MRRCYYCGTKKQDDYILCEKCAKEIEEKIEKSKKLRKEKTLMDELITRFVDFDFESAMKEILSWQDELSTDPDDELTYTVLEGVKDLIIDNCTFE